MMYPMSNSTQSVTGSLTEPNQPLIVEPTSKRKKRRINIQETIDYILRVRMARSRSEGRSREPPSTETDPGMQVEDLDIPPSSRATKPTTVAVQPCLKSISTHSANAPYSTFTAIKIVFEQDARWHGVHPLNIKAEDLINFEAFVPETYRYDRISQAEVAFIPPHRHPRTPPGKTFASQKRGWSAVPIVRPGAVLNTDSCCTVDDGTKVLLTETKCLRNATTTVQSQRLSMTASDGLATLETSPTSKITSPPVGIQVEPLPSRPNKPSKSTSQ